MIFIYKYIYIYDYNKHVLTSYCNKIVFYLSSCETIFDHLLNLIHNTPLEHECEMIHQLITFITALKNG